MRIRTVKTLFADFSPRIQKNLRYDILEDEYFTKAITRLNDDASVNEVREALAKCYMDIRNFLDPAHTEKETWRYFRYLLRIVRSFLRHTGEELPQCMINPEDKSAYGIPSQRSLAREIISDPEWS